MTNLKYPNDDSKQQKILKEDISVDYTKLNNLLATGQWLEADLETAVITIRLAGQEQRGYLDSDDIQNLPCAGLDKLDRLWREFSNGKFGFTIQRKIWLECGGRPGLHRWNGDDSNAYLTFANRVGWGSLRHHELNFNLSAPEGHLPLYYWVKANKDGDVYRCGIDIASLVFRLDACQI